MQTVLFTRICRWFNKHVLDACIILPKSRVKKKIYKHNFYGIDSRETFPGKKNEEIKNWRAQKFFVPEKEFSIAFFKQYSTSTKYE